MLSCENKLYFSRTIAKLLYERAFTLKVFLPKVQQHLCFVFFLVLVTPLGVTLLLEADTVTISSGLSLF